jgi:hypothetical protein
MLLTTASEAKEPGFYTTRGGGYGFRSEGYKTYTHPNGTTQNWLGSGRTRTYNDTTGTRGSSTYGSSGRWGTYGNAGQEWNGSGYTPYKVPSAPTYRRYYNW